LSNQKKSGRYVAYDYKQFLFIRYTFAILVDLMVLNLFDEYWDYVTLSSFTISLLAAIFLQGLLQVTLKIEHYVAEYFKRKEGLLFKVLRGASTWAILFISKLAMLESLELLFPKNIHFTGPIHGAIAFIVVIIAIIVAEQAFIKVNKSLADKE